MGASTPPWNGWHLSFEIFGPAVQPERAVTHELLSKRAEGSTHHPVVFIGVVLLLVMTSALAAFIPARRASGVDPMDALRYE